MSKHYSLIKNFLIVLIATMGILNVEAQTYTVPSSGSNTITACSGTVYDCGGTSSYTNSCSGYLIINSASAGCLVHLEGPYNTESCCDHIYIYDGAGTSGTLLGQYQGTGTISVTSTTGPLTIQFTTDGSVTYDGFALSLSCSGSCTCGGPLGVTSTVGGTSIALSWNAGNGVSAYFVEYGPTGFTPGQGTRVRVNTTSYTITGLTNGQTYDVYIWYDCGNDNQITDEVPTVITATPSLNFTVPTSGSSTITTCAGHLFDSGGATGNYSNSESGYTIIYPEEVGCSVHIDGTYNTESCCDHIYIYDGAGINGTLLGQYQGSGTVDLTSNSGPLTVRFTSDGSVSYSGFDFNIACTGGCNCGGGPYGVVVNTGSHTIGLSWAPGEGVSGYFVEYGPHGFQPGHGTRVRVTTTSYTITGLVNDTQYDVYIWFDCGNDNEITDEIPTMISAEPSIDFIVPATGSNTVTSCEGHLYDCGGADNPYNNSMSGYTIIYPDNPSCVVHLEGNYNTESCCDHIYIYDGAGTSGTQLGQFQGTGTIDVTSSTGPLTLQFTSDGSVTYDGFDLTISCRGGCTCGGSPYGIIVNDDPMGFLVSWTESMDTAVHHYIVEYGLSGFQPGTGTTIIVDNCSVLLTGLTTYATYDIYVYYDCGDDGVVTTENPGLITFCVPDAVACVDFSDLHAPNITCTYGTFSNPYQTTGVVDNGEEASTSRHTVCRTQGTDPRTLNQLQIIPPCELYSVRLGNWETGAEAESISYDYSVDTNVADLILLKYAAVLEDPGHSAAEQPRLTFELLDQNNNMIDATCAAADFIANANLGWNTGTSGVLWKDWTNVGLNISAYHGQTIRFRMTTYDCDQSGHYGYAYFTIGCKKATIVAESCGEMNANTYTAPAGFNYSWYFENAPGTIISTDQSVTVQVGGENNMLCCHVTFIGDPSCGFYLTTSMSARYPLASFDAVRDGCSWAYDFHNTSTISFDGVTPNGTNDPCETAHWDFGDGTTSDQYNPRHEFPGPGSYTVTLVAGLSHDECLDTTTMVIDLLGNYPVIHGDFDICGGQGTTLSATGGNHYVWLENGTQISTENSVFVRPEATTTYTLQSFGADSCEVDTTQVVTILPTSESALTAEICQGEPYTENGFNLPPQMLAGTFSPRRVVPNQYGCDSTVNLTLTVKPLPNTGLGKDFNHCFEDFGDAVLRVPEADCESYTWSTGETTQNITVFEGGTYSVTAVKNGCEHSNEITIFDVCPFNIYLPNAITPTNLDGINDVFRLPGVTDIAEFSIKIFDRWGRLVFSSEDPNFSWNGNINGKIKTNQTYTYRIELKTTGAEKRIIKGILTVL